MSNKLYTARQAAQMVLKRAHELLQKHEHIGWGKLHGKLEHEGYSKESADKIAGAIKAKVHPVKKSEEKEELKKDFPVLTNVPKTVAPAVAQSFSSAVTKSEPIDKIKPKEEAPSDKVGKLKDPDKNPKEQAEGNNELAGTTPTQVGQDGKNIPGGDEIKSSLKLAKFIGHMHAKRQMKSAAAPAEHAPEQQAVGPRAEEPKVTPQSKPTFSAKKDV